MKHWLISAFFLGMLTCATAQKVDLDKWYYTYTYRHLPAKPLSSEFTTYNIVVNAPRTIKNNLPTEQLESLINLEGWRRVEANGHLEILVSLEDLMIEKSEIKERFEVKKDKDNKETGKTYYYWGEIVYTFSGRSIAKTYEGKIINTVELANGYTKNVYKTTEYSNYKDASAYLANNREQLRDQLIRTSVQNAFKTYEQRLNYDYAFPIYSERDYVWLNAARRHPEFEPAAVAVKNIKELMPKVRGDEPLDAAMANMKPTLDYLESVITKYTGKEKEDKKLRYSSYYTLSKLYLALDQPDLAIKYANDLAANDYDTGDAKSLIKDAETVKEQMALNNMKSRHFYIDTSKMEPPAR